MHICEYWTSNQLYASVIVFSSGVMMRLTASLFSSHVLAHNKYIVSAWIIIVEAVQTSTELLICLGKVVVEWVIHSLSVRLRKAFQTGHSHLLWFTIFFIGGGQQYCWVIRLYLLHSKLESYLILTDAHRVDNIHCPFSCQICKGNLGATAWLGFHSAIVLSVFLTWVIWQTISWIIAQNLWTAHSGRHHS